MKRNALFSSALAKLGSPSARHLCTPTAPFTVTHHSPLTSHPEQAGWQQLKAWGRRTLRRRVTPTRCPRRVTASLQAKAEKAAKAKAKKEGIELEPEPEKGGAKDNRTFQEKYGFVPRTGAQVEPLLMF